MYLFRLLIFALNALLTNRKFLDVLCSTNLTSVDKGRQPICSRGIRPKISTSMSTSSALDE
jgi:hypothetical protein